jgi:hypothetical protein
MADPTTVTGPARLAELSFDLTGPGGYALADADWHEPTWCPRCSAVFTGGRWQWRDRPAGAEPSLCPACRRIRDQFPAGYLLLEGPFFERHRHELLRLIVDRAEAARAQEPLERLMAIQGQDDGVLVTTTDVGLARGIGEAVHGAYGGELELHYNAAHSLLRVHWKR